MENTTVNDDLVKWLRDLSYGVPAIKELLDLSEAERKKTGHLFTLQEICQQPITWIETAARVSRHEEALRRILDGGQDCGREVKALILTGSGSSLHAGECVAPALREELKLPVCCIPGGAFLTEGAGVASPLRPCLLVSLARSGDSPESCGAIDQMLRNDPGHYHLIVTCNEKGKLARNYGNLPRVHSLILHDSTNDRSLVMTSSFTNMALSTRFLGMLGRPDEYIQMAERLSRLAREVLLRSAQSLAEVAREEVHIAVFLGSGGALGSAREASLKMLEMSGGEVKTMAETFLGLRHGPMALIRSGTLVVCFLSSRSPARDYELDLIHELDRKELGARKIIVGEHIPSELLQPRDVGVECPGLHEIGDFNAPLIHVLVGQILAFFRCLALGLQPDSPSAHGVISRVVSPFPVY